MAALVAALSHGAGGPEAARLTIWVGGIWLVAAGMLAWLALPGATVWGIGAREFCLGMAGVGSGFVAGGVVWRIVLWRRESARSSP